MAAGGACIICLDTSPPPIQSGCACRGDSGCKQHYTGAMQTGLAEAWRSRVAGQAAESTERLALEHALEHADGLKRQSIIGIATARELKAG